MTKKLQEYLCNMQKIECTLEIQEKVCYSWFNKNKIFKHL